MKKVISISALKNKIARLRKEGKVIAFTNGCFDILHYGHVSYLEAAKKNDSRILIVGLNSDASVRSLEKGEGRPIVPQKERAAVLAGLAAVDFLVIFNESTPYELIKKIRPDILLKGADWKGKVVAGSDLVKRVEFVKYLPGLSTTNVIEKISKLCQKK
ncbi:MAG: adenylyltransferase/cytidyltransferase family protein [Candidatus Omnitrophota bacterium]